MRAIVLCFIAISHIAYSQENTPQNLTIHFDFDSYKLKNAELKKLDSLRTANGSNFKNLQFDLKGHCDSIGSNEYNLRLSENRAHAIQKWLIGHGSRNKNFSHVSGAGRSEPLNENLTEDDRALNRRVELIIYKPAPTATISDQIRDSTTIVGTNIVLRNINFVGGQHIFLPESEPMLLELLDAMKRFPKLVIRVEGHICCVEGAEDGPDNGTGLNNLSEARAMAVMNYLTSNGIAANRITYKGFGHSAPIYPYPESSEAERQTNRRVEIKIIGK